MFHRGVKCIMWIYLSVTLNLVNTFVYILLTLLPASMSSAHKNEFKQMLMLPYIW